MRASIQSGCRIEYQGGPRDGDIAVIEPGAEVPIEISIAKPPPSSEEIVADALVLGPDASMPMEPGDTPIQGSYVVTGQGRDQAGALLRVRYTWKQRG